MAKSGHRYPCWTRANELPSLCSLPQLRVKCSSLLGEYRTRVMESWESKVSVCPVRAQSQLQSGDMQSADMIYRPSNLRPLLRSLCLWEFHLFVRMTLTHSVLHLLSFISPVAYDAPSSSLFIILSPSLSLFLFLLEYHRRLSPPQQWAPCRCRCAVRRGTPCRRWRRTTCARTS